MPEITDVTTYLNRIDALLEFDGTRVTDKFKRVRAATETLIELNRNRMEIAQAQLNDAVTAGETDWIPGLLDAIAAATADIGRPVWYAQIAALTALRDEYASTAYENHEAIATAFNIEADKLRKANSTVNLGLTADAVLPLPRKQQDAWREASDIAHRLNQLTTQLVATADAADVDLHPDTAHNPGDTTIGLVIDPGTSHRRRLWEAWDNTTPRLGKWAPLLQTPGATITARPLPQITPIPRARDYEWRQTQVGGKKGELRGIEQVRIDPEDPTHEEAEDTGFTTVAPLGNNTPLIINDDGTLSSVA